jgi:hypothetical protein
MSGSPDTFEQNISQSIGTLPDAFLWSNDGNWSAGLPADGDAVGENLTGYDNFASLSLSDLLLTNGGTVEVTGSILSVATVSVSGSVLYGEQLTADAQVVGAPVAVSIGTIADAGGVFGAIGAGASLIDHSQTDVGGYFGAVYGGFIEMTAQAASTSVFSWQGGGTIALANPVPETTPGDVNAYTLEEIAPGDVLELPGTSVSAVSYARVAGSLTVTTNLATYVFSNVLYGSPAATTYSAALDSNTGLVAVTFAAFDSFQQESAVASGPFDNDYLWSNAANWSASVPANASDVKANAAGYDDIASLSLFSLTFDGAAEVLVTGSSLAVGDVTAGTGALLVADAEDAGAPVTATVGTVTGTDAQYMALGADASLIVNAASDPGEDYIAENGGLVELAAAPSNGSTLSFAGLSGTIALEAPLSILAVPGTLTNNTVLLAGLRIGDVLELPGTAINAVGFGTNDVTVATPETDYVFSNVTFAEPVNEYTAALDPATGLMAIRFGATDTFSVPDASNSSDYMWNQGTNWNNGLPINGEDIIQAQDGTDDLVGLNLASLGGVFATAVIAPSLNVGTVSVSGLANTYGLGAGDFGYAGSATVTVGTIVTAGGAYGATGADATFINESAIDQGENFYVQLGGSLEDHATPNDASTFEFGHSGGNGTIALFAPAATTTAQFSGVNLGDVLELPGTSVSDLTFGNGSLTVATDAGTYAFPNFQINAAVSTYTAAFDSSTGLVAIRFLGTDTFSVPDASDSSDYMWNQGTNWSDGVPTSGNEVILAQDGTDDIAGLTLVSVGGLYAANIIAPSLTVGTVSLSGLANTYGLGAGDFGDDAPVTVTVGTIVTAGGAYGAEGNAVTFINQSAIDRGEYFYAESGGLLEDHATPNVASTFEFGQSGGIGTIALFAPAATTSAQFSGVDPGDVLELPGTWVSDLTFGHDSLTVTTDAGTYAFTNFQTNAAVTAYSAAFDPGTGLAAITFAGTDTFQPGVSIGQDRDSGDIEYLWSNSANWSDNVPVDDDTVDVGYPNSTNLFDVSFDNIASLTLDTLNLTDGANFVVTGNILNIGTVTGASGGGISLEPDGITGSSGPVTVTVGTITEAGLSIAVQDNPGATFINNSPTDLGETYFLGGGSDVELKAAPSDETALENEGISALGFTHATIALFAPKAINGVAIEGLAESDVIELPGTSVSDVTFGANSLTATTDQGTYSFTDVGFYSNPALDLAPITGYGAAVDPATGLVAITFNDDDTFNPRADAGSGGINWSDPADWSTGTPSSGANVNTNTSSIDDLGTASLGTLDLRNGGGVTVTGSELNVATLVGDSTSHLIADADAPVTVTVGTITGSGGTYEAVGMGGVFQDLSTLDNGEVFIAENGGIVELSAPPADASVLEYVGNPGTFALFAPGATNGVALENVDLGDVLELPGTGVESVNYGTASLAVVTTAGTYDFTNVTYATTATGATTPTGYTAAFDGGTGLVALTVACFAAGTRLLTARGEVAVEAIEVGEQVRVLLGDGDGLADVVWVGRREVDCSGHPKPRQVWPVQVRAGAFGPGAPHSDVWLSPDHAVYVAEALVPVKHLINGSSIVQVPVDRITYHHIELAEHDVLLAEGLPVESYLDTRDGWNYPDRAGRVRLYPDYTARMWEAFGCAPLIVSGPELMAARAVVARFTVEREAA